MKTELLAVLLSSGLLANVMATQPRSAIKARVEGLVAGTMAGKIVFSSTRSFSAFEVYLNVGGGSVTKICQYAMPLADKEYQCSFSTTAEPTINAVNLYVVGVSTESAMPSDQQTLAVANPAYKPPAGVDAKVAPQRLQLLPSGGAAK